MAKFIKQYFLVLPVSLFRMGELSRPNFTYLRTNPPRTDRFDVKLDQDGRILPRDGGLSFFDKPNYRVSPDWWVVEKGTPVPDKFVLIQDADSHPKLPVHYTLAANGEMTVDYWKQTLREWAKQYAIHVRDLESKRRSGT